MTDKEKAIVMTYTGACMLNGEKFQIFHKYVEDLMGRPVMTHEIGFLADVLKEKSKADFIALCTDESGSEKTNNSEISTGSATKKDCNTCTHSNEINGSNCYECVKDIRNNYEPTIQELQAKSDKFDAAFQDGYNNGYAQARFDYEQEPTTKNNLVVEKIVDALGSYTDLDIPCKCEIAENILKNLSSVTPIRPKGHWIEHEHNGKSYIECSECLCWFLSEHLIRNSHCPNCGSRNVAESEIEK